jgi:acyl-CoA synthetase (AMP-forming)/AMP-acid ligase II
MLDVLARLQNHAKADPDAVALCQIAPGCAAVPPMTWRQVWMATNALAERLIQTSEPDSTVLLCSPNRPEFVVAFLAALAADMTVFPVHPALTQAEVQSGQDTGVATEPITK